LKSSIKFFLFFSKISPDSLQTFSLLHTNKRALEGAPAVRTLSIDRRRRRRRRRFGVETTPKTKGR
jgi:hypothetical protein